tara:strand:+ start:118625 stop:118738 length:114 start_codon:yes stop_codon:yes gene_type:complete
MNIGYRCGLLPQDDTGVLQRDDSATAADLAQAEATRS